MFCEEMEEEFPSLYYYTSLHTSTFSGSIIPCYARRREKCLPAPPANLPDRRTGVVVISDNEME